jgi:hypothetical protein
MVTMITSIDIMMIFMVFLITPVCLLFHTAYRLNQEVYDSNVRLLVLSAALQQLEITTKKPWFTSLGPPNKVETTTALSNYHKDMLNNRLNRRRRFI